MIHRQGWKITGILAAVLLVLAACSSDKYRDARALFNDQAKVTEAYVSGLEQAGNAGDVAAVIDKYTDDMKGLIPRIKAFREKHPDLAAFSNNSATPEELKEETERLKTAMAKVQSATMHLMRYMKDPEVRAAFERMGNELRDLGT